METPMVIDFLGMKPVERLYQSIATHIADLEQRFGRITACRVVLKAAGGHHHIGLYEVNVRLALPNGREVNVARTAQQDERYIDVDFAINASFKRARRRLQDRVRRMQGQVKAHEPQPIGTVGRSDPTGELGLSKLPTVARSISTRTACSAWPSFRSARAWRSPRRRETRGHRRARSGC